jgi:hypothetical protein
LDQYPEALLLVQEAWEKAQQSGEVDLTWRIVVVMSRCFIRLARYDEAVIILQQAIPVSQALGRPLAMGQILEPLGYCSAARMDLAGALLSYAGARVQFAKIKSVQGQENMQRCADNLAQLRNVTEMDQLRFSALAKPELR